jgi:hypothetical protein
MIDAGKVLVSHDFATGEQREAFVQWAWEFLNTPENATVAFGMVYGHPALADMAQMVVNGAEPPDALAEILKREWRAGAAVQ